MSELNPNHPVTVEMRQQWHKLCAILMYKMGWRTARITVRDIAAFQDSGATNITVRPRGDTLELKLVSDVEAARLAREGGGLPA